MHHECEYKVVLRYLDLDLRQLNRDNSHICMLPKTDLLPVTEIQEKFEVEVREVLVEGALCGPSLPCFNGIVRTSEEHRHPPVK
jgi:hypothetical protein